MDKLDFQRIAPRYVDGETTEGETHALHSTLLNDTEAQHHIELLEKESEWANQAFKRKPEDISSVMIGVRRRNPYKKLYVPPEIALALQLIFLAGFGALMVKLISELAPPNITFDDRVGKITLADKSVTENYAKIPLRQTIESGNQAQARFLIGSADSLRLNHSSSMFFGAPHENAHHVVELVQGEVWGRFIDPQARFEITLPEIPIVNITGTRAEINVAAGASTCEPLLPRGFNDKGKPLLVTRVIEGRAWVSIGEETHELDSGSTGVLLEGNRFFNLSDPDTAHYPVLRLDGKQRFKQRWDWVNPKHYPLGRETATYTIWKKLMNQVELLSEEYANATSRDGTQEIASFVDQLKVKLLRAESNAQVLSQEELSIPLDQLLQSEQSYVAEHATLLHEKEGNIPLLLAITNDIETILNSWNNKASEYLPLVSCSNISEVVKVLANMEDDLSEILARAYGTQTSIDAMQAELEEARKKLEATQAELVTMLESPQFSGDGQALLALETKLDQIHEELLNFDGIDDEIELARLALAPLEDELIEINNTLHPILARIFLLETRLDEITSKLEANSYDEARLSQAEADVRSWTQRLQLRTTTLQSAKTLSEEQRAKIASLTKRIDQQLTKHADLVEERNTVDESIVQIVATIATLRAQERDTESALDQAQQALAQTPRDNQPARKKAQEKYDTAREVYQSALAKREEAEASKVPLMAQLIELTAQVETAETDVQTTQAEIELAQSELNQTLAQVSESEQELAKATSELEGAKSEHSSQLAQKSEHENLSAERADIEQQMPSLLSQRDTLSERYDTQEARVDPLRERLEELLKAQDERQNLQTQREDIEHEISKLLAFEEQVTRHRLRVANDYRGLISILDRLIERHMQLSSTLATSSIPLPQTFIEQREVWTTMLKGLDEPQLSEEEKEQRSEDALVFAKNFEPAQVELLNERAELNRILREAMLSRRLAVAYMRGNASVLESELAQEHAQQVQIYNLHYREVSGFGEAHDESTNSVAHLLLAQSDSERVPSPQEGPVSEARREDWQAHVLQLLKAQWDLFYVGEISPSAEAPHQKQRNYASMLSADANAPELREFNMRWREHYKTILSDEERQELEKWRRNSN